MSAEQKKRYFKILERGVAHYQNTSLPGENGNVVIFGHSNFYSNAQGEYKQIFAQLNKLQRGDKIKLHFKKKTLFLLG